jgi:hypothetical protein
VNTVHWQGRRELATVHRDDVVALLARRPARWCHTFLVLAAGRAGPSTPDVARRSRRHWYRLWAPDEKGAARFVWHPLPHRDLFSGFNGHLTVEALAPEALTTEPGPQPQGPGCALLLSGEVAGGEPAVTEVVLSCLLDLLAAALDETDGIPGGPQFVG